MTQRTHHLKISGFTLIELIISVAIIGILAAVAYPSYQSYVLKSRRTEAMAGLLDLQQQVEKWRVNNIIYPSDVNVALPSSDYYTFTIQSPTATNYTLKATAQLTQTKDADCLSLTINQNGTKTPANCWSK